jgi:hypothetical protein
MQAVVLAGAVAGCVGTDMFGPTTAASNIPVVGMSDGEFGFAIVASDWTYDQSFAPALTADTLQIGMVVAGYTAGTGTLAITDASGASVFSQNLAGNIAEGGSTTVHGTAPFHVRVTTSRYSGTISLGISPAAPPTAASPLGGERLPR